MPLSAGTAFIDILPNMSKFGAALSTGIRGAASGLKSTGASLTKNLTLPILGAGIASAKLASDFEDEMQKIVGLVGISQDQVDEWSEQILDLSATLPQSPKELAEAMFFVTSAGFEGAEALDVLKASAEAAASGLGETMSVADAVTSAVNAYGSEVLTASDATDILTNTVRLGKAEASSIAPILGSILPTASELGVSFNDVGAAIAAMTRTGDSAASSATKTNAIFSSLVKTTSQQDEAFKKAGTSAKELRTSLAERGLLPTLLDLKDASGGNVAVLAEMFPNVRALRGVLSLTGKQAEKNVQIFDDMAESGGAADAALAAASDTMNFKFKSAMSSLQATAIRFGNILLPIFAQIVSFVARVFEGLGKLEPNLKNIILIVLGVAAAIGPIMWILGNMLLLISPLGLVIAGIAVAAYAIVRNWEKVGPVILPILEGLKDFALRTWETLKRIVGNIGDLIGNLLRGDIPGAGVAIGKMLGFAEDDPQVRRIIDTLQAIRDTVVGVYEAIVRAATVTIRALVRGWQTFIEWFQKVADKTEPVRSAIGDFIALLAKELVPIIDTVKDTVGALVDVFVTALLPAIETIWDALKELWEAFLALWDPALKFVFTILGAVVGVVVILAVKLLGLAVKVIPVLIRFIGTLVRWFANIVKAIATVIKWIAKLIQFFIKASIAITKWVVDLVLGIVDWFKKLPGWVASAVTAMYNKVKEWLGKAVDFVKDKWDGVVDFFSSLGTKLANAGRSMWNWIVDGVKGAINSAISILNRGIGFINKIQIHIHKDLPGPLPDLNFDWDGPNIPTIPYLAEGGIVMNPTMAMIGEAGPEAVVPLREQLHVIVDNPDDIAFNQDGVRHDRRMRRATR